MLSNISKSFQNKHVLRGVDFSPAPGINCILGISGSGKTTLLNIIAGSVTPDSGSVTPNTISYVFQEDRLIPTMSVADNLHYALKPTIQSQVQRTAIIYEVLEAVKLLDEKDSFPSTLSGGMAKRVSLARAFAHPAELILLDEPFRSLDPSLRVRLYKLLGNLQAKHSKTVVFVTHDVEEALLIANNIYLLHDGKLNLIHTDTTPLDTRTILSVAPKREEILNLME